MEQEQDFAESVLEQHETEAVFAGVLQQVGSRVLLLDWQQLPPVSAFVFETLVPQQQVPACLVSDEHSQLSPQLQPRTTRWAPSGMTTEVSRIRIWKIAISFIRLWNWLSA
ncbi:MAG: hypothetical protein ABJZ55_09930 [Fuerstiella sp.]